MSDNIFQRAEKREAGVVSYAEPFFMFFFPYVAFDFVLGGVVGALVVFSQLALQ